MAYSMTVLRKKEASSLLFRELRLSRLLVCPMLSNEFGAPDGPGNTSRPALGLAVLGPRLRIAWAWLGGLWRLELAWRACGLRLAYPKVVVFVHGGAFVSSPL